SFHKDFRLAACRTPRDFADGPAGFLPFVRRRKNSGSLSHLRISRVGRQSTCWHLHHHNTAVCMGGNRIRCQSQAVAGSTNPVFERPPEPRTRAMLTTWHFPETHNSSKASSDSQ